MQSLPSAFWIDSIPEAKEEVGQSHPHDTVPEVNAGSTGSEGPAGLIGVYFSVSLEFYFFLWCVSFLCSPVL